MTSDEAEFAAYMALPDTNRAVFDALLADSMSDSDTRAIMTVLNVIMNEDQP